MGCGDAAIKEGEVVGAGLWDAMPHGIGKGGFASGKPKIKKKKWQLGHILGGLRGIMEDEVLEAAPFGMFRLPLRTWRYSGMAAAGRECRVYESRLPGLEVEVEVEVEVQVRVEVQVEPELGERRGGGGSPGARPDVDKDMEGGGAKPGEAALRVE